MLRLFQSSRFPRFEKKKGLTAYRLPIFKNRIHEYRFCQVWSLSTHVMPIGFSVWEKRRGEQMIRTYKSEHAGSKTICRHATMHHTNTIRYRYVASSASCNLWYITYLYGAVRSYGSYAHSNKVSTYCTRTLTANKRVLYFLAKIEPYHT